MKQFEQSAAKLRETAETLFRDPKLIDVCRHASRDRALRTRILRDPIELLRSRGMDIPPEFVIEFFEPPSRNLPITDWVPFILELTTCRTVWVRECDDGVPRKCTLNSEALCLGFRLYPNPTQPGCIG